MKTAILCIFIFIVSFYLRFSILQSPFWVDEFSSVGQAELFLNQGLTAFSNNQHIVEDHNLTTHFLIALSFKIFGQSEFSARLPFMIIGSIVPVLVYSLSVLIFSKKYMLPASLLTIYSYFQITWSRQARGYALQQLLILLTIFLYLKLLNSKNKIKYFLLLMIIIVLGLLTHFTYFLIIFSIIIHYIYTNFKELKKIIIKPKGLLFIFIVLLGIFSLSRINMIKLYISALISNGLINNLWYYHSFLWREQSLIVFLAIIGFIISIKENKTRNKSILLILPVISFLIFISFLFLPYVSRYVLPIFPIILIYSGAGVYGISGLLNKKHAVSISILITMFIIVNGNQFTLFRKPFYSVNKVMREIALVDYDQVYSLINKKSDFTNRKTAVIDTWIDRIRWYLGDNQGQYYIFRWLDESGTVNGLPKYTYFEINESNEKYIPKTGLNSVKLIGELSDLHKAMKKYQNGFIFIDDQSMPRDVIDYVEQNFYKELYLEHYQLDDNPYSIWPATLYSWGFEEANPLFDNLEIIQ